MAIDRLLIGTRIRKMREEVFNETREVFSSRCGLNTSHISQIERGEILPSLNALDKIVNNTGISLDYLLYGKYDKKKNLIRQNIDNYLNTSSNEELRMYFKCISSIRQYIFKEKNNSDL